MPTVAEILAAAKKPIKKLNLWTPKGSPDPIIVYILDDKSFEKKARQYGRDPTGVGAFAVLPQWWLTGRIYMRSNSLHLFPHEVRHIQEGHFHQDV